MRLAMEFFGSALLLAACSPVEEGAGPSTVDDGPTAEAIGPLAPRDECSSVEGLGALQAALMKAVAARDADALLLLVDENVQLDFGGGSGRAELRHRLTAPDFRLWDEIEAALALGCGFATSADGGHYAAWPWYFSKDVIPLDPYEAMIVTGSDVPLRAGPSAASEQIGAVSWDYVQLRAYSNAAFQPVVTRDGQQGYIDASKLRGLVDYRIIADKTDAGWIIGAIIAGD